MHLCSALQYLSIYKWSKHMKYILIFLLFTFNYQKKNLFAWSSWTGGTCHRYIPTNTVNFYCGSSLQGSCIRIFKLSDHIFHLPVYFLFVPDSAVFQTVVICGGIRILLVNVICKLESVFVYANKLPKLGFYTM